MNDARALQPALFSPRSRLEREFDEFDSANPDVWHLFCRFAREALGSGRMHFSADGILHRIRWFTAVEISGARGFKVNDHHSTFYARKFIRLFPEHRDFFELRPRRERASST